MNPVRYGARQRATAAALAFACALASTGTHAQSRAPVRILFVGNSYIYTNDLPEVVEALAASRGQTVVVGEVTRPNYAIADHLALGVYQQELQRGWDWVILQQGPSSLPESRVDLRENAMVAAQAARAAGARVALLAAWPAQANLHTQANAELSYREAAVATHACVLPVSTGWRLTREMQPSIRLYQGDQLHPTRDGTLLTAQIVVRGLLGARAYPSGLALERLLGGNWRQAGTRFGVLDAIAAASDVEPERCLFGK